MWVHGGKRFGRQEIVVSETGSYADMGLMSCAKGSLKDTGSVSLRTEGVGDVQFMSPTVGVERTWGFVLPETGGFKDTGFVPLRQDVWES